MRLWSLHPALLDRQALVAAWREGLLAQAVLAGRTTGYRQHPQLRRFAAQPDPSDSLRAYLDGLADEADRRGYRFDRRRVDAGQRGDQQTMTVTQGQLDYEWQHLLAKVAQRNPQLLAELSAASPRPHPLFLVVPGDVEEWERR